jgi:pimeloyl-ACP methyl ester carboxylesterase
LAPELRPRPVQIAGNFGWFHAASATRAPVLMCPPFGVEALASHIGWRNLATRLAAQGHDVLRLDYPGTGHSPGAMKDPDRLARWQTSIAEAVTALRQATGAAQVIVIGMRLGASLAAKALQGRTDIAALVALAPVVSGRRHAREITALAQMQGESGISPGGIVLYGFEIAQDTLENLSTLDLAALPAPAPRGLVCSRGAAEEALASRWGFDQAPFEGFEALTENPTHAKVPEAVFAQVVAWCAAQPAPPRAPAGPALPPARSVLEEGLVEEAVLFGPEAGLFGVISRPAEPPSPLAVIIANAGRNPASGWGRRGVELARSLACAGHATLLFDGTGIGDSERGPDHPEEVLYAPRQEEDVLAAAHLMLSRGAKAVFIIGSCSSAYSGLHAVHRASALGGHIAGLAMVNLIRFHWRPGESLDVASAQSSFRPTEAYGRRIFQRETWQRMLRGDIALGPIAATLLRRGAAALRRPLVQALAACGLATSREAEAMGWFRTLEARQVRVMMVYSQEDPGLAELAAYFGPEGRRLKALRHVSLHLLDGGDHNFSRVDGRAALTQLLLTQIGRLAQELSGSGKTAPRQ